MVPRISPLAARSRLAARATDAKIRLWRIKHRRVQTAAVGLCRGVYVFIGRVAPVIRHAFSSGLCTGVCRQPQWVYVGVFMYSLAGWQPVLRSEICHIIHAGMLSRLFMGFSAGCFSLSRPLCSVNLSWTNFARKTTSRGTIPHIIPNYPRAHYNAGLNTSAAVCRRRYLVSVRNLSIRCACNQTRVCRRKCSGRRLPNESVPTEVFRPAASDGRVLAGVYLSIRWVSGSTGVSPLSSSK